MNPVKQILRWVVAEIKKFGPYKGSDANGGRPIYVYKKKVDGKWVTTSQNKARADFESANGKLSKKVDVDHKDNNKKNDAKSNLRALPHGKNTAKENKRRAGKKP
jgi:hypothetical protein